MESIHQSILLRMWGFFLRCVCVCVCEGIIQLNLHVNSSRSSVLYVSTVQGKKIGLADYWGTYYVHLDKAG
jgi:hypothetical protein